LLAAGCGTGGIAKGGDPGKGKQLFQAKCGGCHTLADAGTHGQTGPNLDDAFGPDRKQGFKESTIRQVVADQIKFAGDYGTSGPTMPRNLVKGRDVDFRVSIMPSIFGEDAVLRILDKKLLADEFRDLTARAGRGFYDRRIGDCDGHCGHAYRMRGSNTA